MDCCFGTGEAISPSPADEEEGGGASRESSTSTPGRLPKSCDADIMGAPPAAVGCCCAVDGGWGSGDGRSSFSPAGREVRVRGWVYGWEGWGWMRVV